MKARWACRFLPAFAASVLLVTGPALALEIGLIRPGQDLAGEARGVLQHSCTRLIVTDNAREDFITCDLKNGDLLTANAVKGGPIYWITYRTEARASRAGFVEDVRSALGYQGPATPCGSGLRAAECWRNGSLRLEILNAADPAGRWVAVEEDESLVP